MEAVAAARASLPTSPAGLRVAGSIVLAGPERAGDPCLGKHRIHEDTYVDGSVLVTDAVLAR